MGIREAKCRQIDLLAQPVRVVEFPEFNQSAPETYYRPVDQRPTEARACSVVQDYLEHYHFLFEGSPFSHALQQPDLNFPVRMDPRSEFMPPEFERRPHGEKEDAKQDILDRYEHLVKDSAYHEPFITELKAWCVKYDCKIDSYISSWENV